MILEILGIEGFRPSPWSHGLVGATKKDLATKDIKCEIP